MKTQGINTVPVQNGQAVKKSAKQSNKSNANADFMAVMNGLSLFSGDQSKNGSQVKKDSSSDAKTSVSTSTSVPLTRMSASLKASYQNTSDSHIINAAANTQKSTETKDTTDAKAVKDDTTAKATDGKETKDTKKASDTTQTDAASKTDSTSKDTKVDRDAGVSGPETEDSTADDEEVKENYSSNILETISGDLGVDNQTVLNAMSQLGLSFADLSDQSNVAQLYTTITGASQADLLTSADFTALVEDINSEISDVPADVLAQMTPVTEEDAKELSDYIDSFGGPDDGISEEEDIQNEIAFEAEDIDPNCDYVDPDDGTLTEEVNEVSDDTVKAANVTDDTADNAVTDTTAQTDDTTVTPQTTVQSSNASDLTDESDLFGKNSGQQNGTTQTEEVNTNAAQTNVNAAQTPETAFAETVSQVTKYTDINTDDLINQIVSKAKQTLSDTVKSLEMELNPASLGKLFLQVSEKSGDISAHIYAQNEAVRHALENRLADLQDNLNKQGIRVNEVTISVEPHAFERNLEENTNSNFMNDGNAAAFAEQGSNTGAATAGRTTGSIDVREGFDGTQTAEDELTASIMRDNGNTVSYLA